MYIHKRWLRRAPNAQPAPGVVCPNLAARHGFGEARRPTVRETEREGEGGRGREGERGREREREGEIGREREREGERGREREREGERGRETGSEGEREGESEREDAPVAFITMCCLSSCMCYIVSLLFCLT
jgi:hypothetical protein